MIPDLPTPDVAPAAGGKGGPARDGTHAPPRAAGHCTSPDCNRPLYARGLCSPHWTRQHRGSTKTGPISEAAVVLDGETYMPCPDGLLPLAAQAAENDARQLFTLLWRAIGDWHLQGFLEEHAS